MLLRDRSAEARRVWRETMYLDHLHERKWESNLSPRQVKSLFLADFGGFSGFIEGTIA